MPAKIVVNERTGTIVMGKDVRIAPVAILHGNLSVEIQTKLLVSQPGPLSPKATTEVVPETTVKAKDEPAKNVILKEGSAIEELVRALTAIGSTARDIIAILQNLRAARRARSGTGGNLMTIPSLTPDVPVDTAQLKRTGAAKDFEALLLGQMLHSVREADSGWLGTGEDQSSEAAFGLGEQELAKALSQSGGIGLSKMIDRRTAESRT